MRGILKAIGIIAVVFLVVAQFVRINRTNPPSKVTFRRPRTSKRRYELPATTATRTKPLGPGTATSLRSLGSSDTT